MTPLDAAQRFVGEVKEVPGEKDHPLIQWWLSLCGFGFDVHDEVAWCSAMVNGIAWQFRLPRSKSAAARSWLGVGTSIALEDARPGYDVVVLSRGSDPAQGHVGFFAGTSTNASGKAFVRLVSGNVGNQVTLEDFPAERVLGVRRLG